MKTTPQRWLGLVLGLVAIAAFVGLIHLSTIHLGGATGRLIEENRQKDLEVYAYVYSEVGDLEDFLDDDAGKYGRAALIKAIGHKDRVGAQASSLPIASTNSSRSMGLEKKPSGGGTLRRVDKKRLNGSGSFP